MRAKSHLICQAPDTARIVAVIPARPVKSSACLTSSGPEPRVSYMKLKEAPAMDFSIQSQPFRTQAIQPTVSGKAGGNVVDLDPSAIVEQFAKMLVAQISNQDPDNAMDP